MTKLYGTFNPEIAEIVAAYPATKPRNRPAIYVACLAAYNEGILHGTWIDCTIGVDYVHEAIRDMIADSPADYPAEYAIHDYENFGGYRVDEWDNIGELCEIAELLSEDKGPVIIELMDYLAYGIESAKEYFEDKYLGEYDDLGNFAYEDHHANQGPVSENLRHYINWDQMGEDMETNGNIMSIDHGNSIHVFSNP